jgi:hypothetical protein
MYLEIGAAMTKEMDPIQPTAPISDEDPIKAAYIAQARRQYTKSTDDIEIDDDPNVGIAEGGAWVAAWVWVTQEEAGFGKEDATQSCES